MKSDRYYQRSYRPTDEEKERRARIRQDRNNLRRTVRRQALKAMTQKAPQ